MAFWGASWASGKVIANRVPPDVIVFWRLTLTFLSFLIMLLILNRGKLKLSFSTVLWIVFPSLFFVIYNKLFFEGLKIGLAGKGGVIVTTLNPLLTFIITIVFLKHRVSTAQIIGLFIGLAGGVILLEIWDVSFEELLLSGNLYFAVSALAWAIVTVLTQYALNRIDFQTFCLYVYGTNTILSALPHNPAAVFQQDHVFWLNMLYISLGAISFATSVYFYASKKLGSNRTSSFTFIVPFTAVSSCWIFLHEKPAALTIIGGLLALLAIYIINFSSEKIK
jgi:drug/metabolite transporter (DMT)-like permease